MLAACGESPSVEVEDAVFDQSVMYISEELGAPPQEATRTDGIEVGEADMEERCRFAPS